VVEYVLVDAKSSHNNGSIWQEWRILTGPRRKPLPFLLPLFTQVLEEAFSEVRAELREVASCSKVEREDPL
jgi:hypothetical protein